MKIGCSEVPKPTYPSLLWLAEWKVPAPLYYVIYGRPLMAEENVLAATDLVTARSWILILLLKQLFGSDTRIHCTFYSVPLLFSLNILRSPLLWSSHHCQCQTPQKRRWSRSPRKRTNLMIILKHNPTIHNLVAARNLWNLTILQETGH